LGLKGTRQQGSGENYIMRGFNHLYSSPNNIWMIKSRRMRWAGHVAQGSGGENLKDKDRLKELGVDWKIILEWMREGEVWTSLIRVMIGTGGGPLGMP